MAADSSPRPDVTGGAKLPKSSNSQLSGCDLCDNFQWECSTLSQCRAFQPKKSAMAKLSRPGAQPGRDAAVAVQSHGGGTAMYRHNY